MPDRVAFRSFHFQMPDRPDTSGLSDTRQLASARGYGFAFEGCSFRLRLTQGSRHWVRLRLPLQGATVSNCRTAKLPNCQTAQLPNCRTAKLPNCQLPTARSSSCITGEGERQEAGLFVRHTMKLAIEHPGGMCYYLPDFALDIFSMSRT